ncbi:hypothetical protein [Klebsiella variicola]|uniref:hypothetical protein n=1 Tax=Klebsiella variicola TaxID=244366 RepID=UPI0034DE8807
MTNEQMFALLNTFYLAGFNAGCTYVQKEATPIIEALVEELKPIKEAEAFECMNEYENGVAMVACLFGEVR